MIFEEVAADSFYVGGVSHGKFVRLKLEHMARTLPEPIVREWWVKAVDQLIAPYVRDRGYDWEVTIDEVPADLWSLQGEIPPPFESHAEKRWVKENQASPYGLQEKLPVGALFTPGVTENAPAKAAGSRAVDRCKAPLRCSGAARIEGSRQIGERKKCRHCRPSKRAGLQPIHPFASLVPLVRNHDRPPRGAIGSA